MFDLIISFFLYTGIIFIGLALFGFYFFPSLIATELEMDQSGVIGKTHLTGMWITNFVFGWTIIGWFLIWFWILFIVGKKGIEEGISNLKRYLPT